MTISSVPRMPVVPLDPTAQLFLAQDFTGMFESLSRQQAAVMDHVACGLSNKEIARNLSLSLSTIKTHLLAIYQKTRVSNRIQLALYWLRYRGVIMIAGGNRAPATGFQLPSDAVSVQLGAGGQYSSEHRAVSSALRDRFTLKV